VNAAASPAAAPVMIIFLLKFSATTREKLINLPKYRSGYLNGGTFPANYSSAEYHKKTRNYLYYNHPYTQQFPVFYCCRGD
jgi:hypothetical protein